MAAVPLDWTLALAGRLAGLGGRLGWAPGRELAKVTRTAAAGGRLRPGDRYLASQAAIRVFGFLAIAAITVGIVCQVLAGLVLERPLLIVAALLYGVLVTSAALTMVGYTVSDSSARRAAVVRRNVSLLGLAFLGLLTAFMMLGLIEPFTF